MNRGHNIKPLNGHDMLINMYDFIICTTAISATKDSSCDTCNGVRLHLGILPLGSQYQGQARR